LKLYFSKKLILIKNEGRFALKIINILNKLNYGKIHKILKTNDRYLNLMQYFNLSLFLSSIPLHFNFTQKNYTFLEHPFIHLFVVFSKINKLIFFSKIKLLLGEISQNIPHKSIS